MFSFWTNTHFRVLKLCVHCPNHNFLSLYCAGLLLQRVVLNIQFPILVSCVVRCVCWQSIFALCWIFKQGKIKWKASVSSTWKWSPCFVFSSAGNKTNRNGTAGPQRRHYYTPQTVLWLWNGTCAEPSCLRMSEVSIVSPTWRSEFQGNQSLFWELKALGCFPTPPSTIRFQKPTRFLKVFH